MKYTRRTFFKQIAGFAVLSGGLQMFLSACGSSSSSTAAGNCTTNGTTVTIGANHGHAAPVIATADVAAEAQKQYSLGPADATASPPNHIHTFTVTAATFSLLQGNTAQTVTTDADNTGHSHPISIGCA